MEVMRSWSAKELQGWHADGGRREGCECYCQCGSWVSLATALVECEFVCVWAGGGVCVWALG